MSTFKVQLTVIFKKTVTVDAISDNDANQSVLGLYRDGDIFLGADDLSDYGVEVV